MSSSKYTYLGETYSQGESELEIISFCASANDIVKWAGVPHKTSKFHGGFQRALDDKRYENIQKFFNNGQCSPTSIVVAFKPGMLNLTDIHLPDTFDASKLNYPVRLATATFDCENLDPDTVDLYELASRVAEMIAPRLENSGDVDPGVEDEQESGEGDEVEPVSDESSETDGELDVGHSKLKEFHTFISDKSAIEAWLGSELKVGESPVKRKRGPKPKSQESLSPEKRKQELILLLISLLRPAMIVDGQHRVWGAYHSERSPITFNVCAIKDADWVEQIFQFVILNKLAKPISPSFLTGLLNTSLTNMEVRDIETKLDVIGIRNTDRKIMKYLNHDSKSPFFGMIAEAGEIVGVSNSGKLSDKGMIKLAKRWKNLDTPANMKQLKMFHPALEVDKSSNARSKWKNYEVWISYFFTFWRTIKDIYEPSQIWVKSERFKLLYIVTMNALQDKFLDDKARGDAEFQSEEDFASQVKRFFSPVTSNFFQGWEATSLQSGEGPDWIKDAIEELRKGSTLAKLQKDSPLYQKPTSMEPRKK